MIPISDVKKVIDEIKKHNDEQNVIRRMNEPLKAQCEEWYKQMKSKSVDDENVLLIMNKLRDYLDNNRGLEDLRKLTSDHLSNLVKSKMEELNAYKH